MYENPSTVLVTHTCRFYYMFVYESLADAFLPQVHREGGHLQ